MWLISGVVVLAFVSYVALPFGLAWYVPQLAARYGVHFDVEQVRVDPFRSRLRLSGVRVATTGDAFMEWSSIETRVDLAELLSGRLALDDFHLSEATLHAAGQRAGVSGAPPAVPPTALPGDVSIGALVVAEVELAMLTEALGRPVTIDWLQVSSIDEAFGPGGAEIEAHVAVGAGRCELQGRLSLDATGWILDADANAKEVPLDGIPEVLGAGGSWRGRLDGSGPVRLVYSPVNGAFSATADGRWAVDGLEFGLDGTEVSAARVDWDGVAFMVFSEGAVDALSVDVEVGLHDMDIDVDDALQVGADALMLQIDASQASATRLSISGDSPEVRFSGKGGAFEGIEAEATNLASLVALTFADGVGIEVDRLTAGTLATRLPAGRSVDVGQIALERAVVGLKERVVSVAAATAERLDWLGVSAPGHAGTANRVAMHGFEQRANSEFRLALGTAKAVEERIGDSDLRMRDVELDSTSLSPGDALAAGGVRISEAWLMGESSTLVLESLSLEGVERNEEGVISTASGRARVVDHTLMGRSSVVGSGVELAGASVAGDAWEAEHVRFGRMDVETGVASYTLREFGLVGAEGAGVRASARLARLGALEHGFGGNRILLKDLYALAPTWREGAGGAEAIEATSLNLDAVDGNRWRSRGWRLTGVEMAASGDASAQTASLENLTLNANDDAMATAQGIELGGLTFGDGYTATSSSASIGRTHYRAGSGQVVDVIGLRANALEWNRGTLLAGHGAAPLMSVVAPPVSASFDTLEFASVLFGAGGVKRLDTLESGSSRGRVGPALEWSTGRLEVGGYLASAPVETALDVIEALDVEVRGAEGEVRLGAVRLSALDARIDSSGTTEFASAQAHGIALRDASGRESTSARMLQASRMTVGESAMEIGSVEISTLDSTIGVTERGDWELPALPIGIGGGPRSSFRIRIDEARTSDSASVVGLVDRTTVPHFETRIDIANATLRGIDSAAIGTPAHFSVEAAAGIFTGLRADGVVVPTLTGTDVDLNAAIRGLSLPDLSPYSRLHLGQDIEDGHADVRLDLTVRTSDLEGTAEVMMREFALGGAGPPGASPGLGAALTSLEDEHGAIMLKAPLRGELDSPDFDLDGLLIRSLARAALDIAETLPEAE